MSEKAIPEFISCADAAENDFLYVVRLSHIQICKGCHTQANLLNVLIRWTNLSQKRHPKRIPFVHLTEEELFDEILGAVSVKTIRRAMRSLEQHGLIEIHRKPGGGVDNTKHYLLLTDELNRRMADFGRLMAEVKNRGQMARLIKSVGPEGAGLSTGQVADASGLSTGQVADALRQNYRDNTTEVLTDLKTTTEQTQERFVCQKNLSEEIKTPSALLQRFLAVVPKMTDEIREKVLTWEGWTDSKLKKCVEAAVESMITKINTKVKMSSPWSYFLGIFKNITAHSFSSESQHQDQHRAKEKTVTLRPKERFPFLGEGVLLEKAGMVYEVTCIGAATLGIERVSDLQHRYVPYTWLEDSEVKVLPSPIPSGSVAVVEVAGPTLEEVVMPMVAGQPVLVISDANDLLEVLPSDSMVTPGLEDAIMPVMVAQSDPVTPELSGTVLEAARPTLEEVVMPVMIAQSNSVISETLRAVLPHSEVPPELNLRQLMVVYKFDPKLKIVLERRVLAGDVTIPELFSKAKEWTLAGQSVEQELWGYLGLEREKSYVERYARPKRIPTVSEALEGVRCFLGGDFSEVLEGKLKQKLQEKPTALEEFVATVRTLLPKGKAVLIQTLETW